MTRSEIDTRSIFFREIFCGESSLRLDELRLRVGSRDERWLEGIESIKIWQGQVKRLSGIDVRGQPRVRLEHLSCRGVKEWTRTIFRASKLSLQYNHRHGHSFYNAAWMSIFFSTAHGTLCSSRRRARVVNDLYHPGSRVRPAGDCRNTPGQHTMPGSRRPHCSSEKILSE